MIELLKLFTFIMLTIIVLSAILNILKGYSDSIYIVKIVFYIFFVLPLLFDLFIGIPDYKRYPGVREASNDELTNFIYCIYIIFVSVIWYFTGRSKKRDVIFNKFSLTRNISSKRRRFLITLLYFCSIFPLVLLIFSPEPMFYLEYGGIVELEDKAVKDFHNYIALCTVMSVVSCAGLLMISNKLKPFMILYVFSITFISSWLNGKRAVVSIACILLVYAFWSKGLLKGKRLIVAGLLVILIFSSFTLLYQYNVRDINIAEDYFYENIRIDYGRDDVTKLTIYSELNPDKSRILEFRGQSILFYLTAFVPRESFPNKPWPYAVYMTSSVLGLTNNTYIGWGMTTSWLEEAIANFSWGGMVLGPLFISLICRIGDSCISPIIPPITMLLGSLMLTVHPIAFWYVWVVWIGFIMYEKIKILTTAKRT